MGSHDKENAATLHDITGHKGHAERFEAFVKASRQAVEAILDSGKPVAEMKRGADLWQAEALAKVKPLFGK